MTDDHKTALQWSREGRIVRKGEHAELYRVSDDRTQGRALFRRDQTDILGPDDTAGWTITISAADWELTKAERKEISRRPLVKVRKHAESGCEVWCGPDKDIIELLTYHGYRYRPDTRYWYHPNKDAASVADAFANGKIRGQRIRVDRTWEHHDGLVV